MREPSEKNDDLGAVVRKLSRPLRWLTGIKSSGGLERLAARSAIHNISFIPFIQAQKSFQAFHHGVWEIAGMRGKRKELARMKGMEGIKDK